MKSPDSLLLAQRALFLAPVPPFRRKAGTGEMGVSLGKQQEPGVPSLRPPDTQE